MQAEMNLNGTGGGGSSFAFGATVASKHYVCIQQRAGPGSSAGGGRTDGPATFLWRTHAPSVDRGATPPPCRLLGSWGPSEANPRRQRRGGRPQGGKHSSPVPAIPLLPPRSRRYGRCGVATGCSIAWKPPDPSSPLNCGPPPAFNFRRPRARPRPKELLAAHRETHRRAKCTRRCPSI